jgi:hypothetical protein
MDRPTAENLLTAIVSQAEQRESYATKTKILKLLYLFDVEYFRIHRRTFTGFAWKFFHLGPWTSEYETTLDGIVASGALEQKFGKHDTPMYHSPERVDASIVRLPPEDDSILRGVLRRWAGADTRDILDYVYFNTEPMQQGIRNESLDFSVIPKERPPQYRPTSSGVGQKEVEHRKALFAAKRAGRKAKQKAIRFTPPRYDEEFERAIAAMQAED